MQESENSRGAFAGWDTTYGESRNRYINSRVGFVGPMRPSARPRIGKLFLRSGRAGYSGSSGSSPPFRLGDISSSTSSSLMWSSKPLPARLTTRTDMCRRLRETDCRVVPVFLSGEGEVLYRFDFRRDLGLAAIKRSGSLVSCMLQPGGC